MGKYTDMAEKAEAKNAAAQAAKEAADAAQLEKIKRDRAAAEQPIIDYFDTAVAAAKEELGLRGYRFMLNNQKYLQGNPNVIWRSVQISRGDKHSRTALLKVGMGQVHLWIIDNDKNPTPQAQKKVALSQFNGAEADAILEALLADVA